MNKNPLLVKSALIGKIPFMKNKTRDLYLKYISDHRLSRVLSGRQGLSETLSAYSIGSTYETDLVFDSIEINTNSHFSENEWIALGMLLRAYKEVEGINLMHLYNCLYSHDNNIISGHVVTGRTYTLYTSTQFPLKVTIGEKRLDINPTSVYRPVIIEVPKSDIESLIDIKIEYFEKICRISYLVEGAYVGLDFDKLNYPLSENRLIPGFMGIGEYSPKLVEFFAGTLITDLSNKKLISNVDRKLNSPGQTFKERVNSSTSGWCNKDGYCDRRVKV